MQPLALFHPAVPLGGANRVDKFEVLNPVRLKALMDRLVAQSLLSLERTNGTGRYRFLNTTRTYALEKLEHSGELRLFEARYARYVSRARWVSGVQVPLELVE